ncbi:MAG: bifunctional 4-hydroxy-2-oxoglutarate aldolase/2-dehydro-3-deoxy-phosphogluconate aldolase [Solirubrobacteraceae bacterium]
MPERLPITPQLQQSGVVAILRGSSDRHLAGVSRTLGEAGVTCLELTLTMPGAVGALGRVRAELDDHVALGMGSVLDADQARACLDAGAEFLVSPGVCSEVAAYAAEHEVACYPGGWTPTEVLEAWRLGAPAVKLFPAVSGGPRHLRDLHGPLPHIPLVPTGGVALDQIADYVAAGAVAVGLGGPLLGDALDGGSLPALAERARDALDAVRAGRERR